MKNISDEVVQIETLVGPTTSPPAGCIISAGDYGDLIVPASPTSYDDEFTGTLNTTTKWTVAGTVTGQVTCANQAPSYLQMASQYGTSGAFTLTCTETIVTAAGFMFQWKVRLLLTPFFPTAATSAYMAATCGLLFGTTNSIGLKFYAQTSGGTTPLQYSQPLVYNGNAFGTQVKALASGLLTGLDYRIRIGLSGANLVVQLSPDGWNWLTVYSEVFASGPSLTNNFPTSLRMQLDNAGTGNANSSGMACWDYVRKIA
jgi:hypothetical protein